MKIERGEVRINRTDNIDWITVSIAGPDSAHCVSAALCDGEREHDHIRVASALRVLARCLERKG